MSETLEQRIQAARQAILALYLDDPSPDSAKLLVTLERTVAQLRTEQANKVREAADWSGVATATAGWEVSSGIDITGSTTFR